MIKPFAIDNYLSDKQQALLTVIPITIIHLYFYNLTGYHASMRHVDYAYFIKTTLDQRIPFIPSFDIFYLFTFIYPFLIIVYLLKKAQLTIYNFYRIYIAAIVMILFCTAIWSHFPNHFVLRVNNSELAHYGFWGAMVAHTYSNITDWNACPSFHIAISWFILRMSQMYTKKTEWPFVALFFAIAASTVLIRIHYIADICFGILVAELACNVLLRNFEKYSIFQHWSKTSLFYGYILILGAMVLLLFLGV